jgi:hypothetical protein
MASRNVREGVYRGRIMGIALRTGTWRAALRLHHRMLPRRRPPVGIRSRTVADVMAMLEAIRSIESVEQNREALALFDYAINTVRLRVSDTALMAQVDRVVALIEAFEDEHFPLEDA